MINQKIVVYLWGCFLICVILTSCFSSENPAAQRAERARRAQGPIVIGAASPWSGKHNLMVEGIKLAVAEINADGGILGRNLELVFADDKATLTTGQLVAQKFADNPDMVAVIGHTDSYISIPVSIVYEYYGILMMSPLSTSPQLTRRNFKLVFRNIPTDLDYGIAMARLCQQRQLKRALILHANNKYGISFANAFENECRMADIEVVDRAAYDSGSGIRFIKEKLKFWQRNYQFDCLVLAAEMPEAADIVICARELGIKAVFLGGDDFDTADFIKVAGSAAEGMIIPSIFHPGSPQPSVINFVKKFKQQYGEIPDLGAEQGYDAINVLTQAIKAAKTIEPLEIAATLRSGKEWRGVTDNYFFDEHGDVKGRKIFFKIVKGGDFALLSD